MRDYRNFREADVASDSEFTNHRKWFAYDKEDLRTTTKDTDSKPDWTHEEIVFDGPNGDDLLSAGLFLPRDVEPPYQVVICLPTGSGFRQEKRRPVPGQWFPFIVKEGRALLETSLRGTYERPRGYESAFPSPTINYRNHVVEIVQEFQKCVDYLESRPDTFDTEKIALFGFSYGGGLGAIIPAIETRLRASVLLSGGLWMQTALEEVDQIHFLPRVKVPTLMINNEMDYIFDLRDSQEPMFDLLGVSDKDKRHAIYDGKGPGHHLPGDFLQKKMLSWLDKYLGHVRSPTTVSK